MKFGDTTFEIINLEKLTPGEADAIERVSGLTFQKIRRRGEMCVCEHAVAAHQRGEEGGDAACGSCGCPDFEADLPVVVSTAVIWVSLKRVLPQVKFSEVADTPFVQFTDGDQEAAVDPS